MANQVRKKSDNNVTTTETSNVFIPGKGESFFSTWRKWFNEQPPAIQAVASRVFDQRRIVMSNAEKRVVRL